MKRLLKRISGISVFVFALSAGAQWIDQTEPLAVPPEPALSVTNILTGPVLSPEELQGLVPVSAAEPQMLAMSFPAANPEASVVAALASQLEHNVFRMFNYVCDKIRTEPYLGLIRSPERTLLDGAGSPMEQAHLFSELVRAGGVSGATKFDVQALQLPLQPEAGFDICDFTGVSNAQDALNLLANGGLYVTNISATAVIRWVRVGVQTTAGWYYFDPSLKTHAVPGSFDFYSAMSYSRSNLLAEAGGTTNAAGWATGLNESAITDLLNQYASGMLASVRTNSALSLEPGRILSALRWGFGPVGTVPPYSDIEEIFPEANGRIILRGGGLSPLTLNTRETAHKKISIRFTADSAYKVQIYLGDGGSPVRTEGGAGGGYNTAFDLTVDTIHNGVTNSQPYSLKRGAGLYVLCQSFGGGCSSAMSGYVSKNITALKQRGYADDSPEVFTESLRYTGQRWTDQEADVRKYIQAVSPKKTVVKYKIGIMAGETDSFYIDAKNGYAFSAGSGSDFIGSYMASSLEHAVLEQLQPGNAKGISTIRILKQANATNMPVYRATSNNWNSIKNSISNYSNKAVIESDMNTANGFFILPQSGSVAVGTNWSGNGYVMSKTVSGRTAYGMMIGGDYNGGYNAWKNPYVPKIQQTSTRTVYIPPVKTYTPPKSFDPVDMQTGAFLFDHDDLSLAGPLPLTLHRSYRSDSGTESVIGTGWTHSFDIRAAEYSAIDQSFGERAAEDMVPLLTGMSVIRDLLDNETGAKDWVAAALVADWTVQQLTGNGVSVSLGSKALTFVKQPDGSYTPPPGMTVSLSKTNGVYVMQERNASTYMFNTNNLIAQIADPDGNTLTFTYNAQTNLQTVVSSFGPQLMFSYTGGTQLVSIADNSSPARTVQYQYDAKNNLTNFTDAADKHWGVFYSDTNHPHAITSLKDPENITTIQNFYNAFGQVTNQISASGQNYGLSVTDYISFERNPLNQSTVYFYDDKGRTVQTQKPDGTSRYSRFDNWDRVTNSVSEAGVTNVFVYDMENNLRLKTIALGTPEEVTTGYGYDSSNHLRFVTNALGTAEQTVTEYTYTGTHHVDTITEAEGSADQKVTDFDYFNNGLLQQKSEGNGLRVTGYTYDGYGNPDTFTSADAGTVETLFNLRGEIKEQKIGGVTTAYFYDPRGLLTNTVSADGTPDQISESRTYYDNGLLKTVTDARNRTTQYLWTPAYKPAGAVYPDTGSTTNLYDAADRLTHTRDAEGHWAEFQLDAVGRVTNTVGELTAVSSQYDPAGNVTNSTVDPSGLNLWTAAGYDALNRPLNRQSAIANQQFFYDPLSRITNRIDQLSNHWKTEYDALGRVKKTFRPSENYEETGYNALGGRTQFWNAERKPMTFGMDAQGRVTVVTNAIGKATSFTYNDAGNLTDRENAKHEITHYDYNALNRLTNIVHEGQWQASFEYDPNGNRTGVSNQASAVSLAYDSMNRLTNSVLQVSGFTSQVSSSYDLNGNRTNIVYPGGKSVGYTYDEENRLSSVNLSDFGLSTFDFHYDGASRLTNMLYPNGVNGQFEYDAESCITGFGYSGSSNFISRSMVRDPRGYKTSENIISGLEPEMIEGEQRMEHNAADQLTKITQRDSWLGGELNQWYNREYGYDDNGCLLLEYVSRELWNTNSAIDEYRAEYTWDYDNRLTGTEKTVLIPHDEIDGMTGAVMDRTYTDGPSVSTEYIYDASGVRIGRIHNSVTNYFVLDYRAPLKMPLAETDADGHITRYYIWGSYGLLAHLDVTDNGSQITVNSIRYYHADEQGSTLALTDENGTVTDQFAYTPYGGVNHTGSTDTPYTWLGGLAVRAEGNGLYFMLNRYYSANMRRFISTDKMGIDGGPNLYTYANLNPNAYSDPYGLCADYSSPFMNNTGRSLDPGPPSVAGAGGLLPFVGDADTLMSDASWGWKAAAIGSIALDATGIGLIPGTSTSTFRTGTKAFDVGQFNDLKRLSTSGDALDIHHVGQKHVMSQVVDGYNPSTAPSIAIPANQHRLIPTVKGAYSGTARDILANDIRNLRNYTDTPNSSLQELIRLNKQQYPSVFNP